MSKNKNMGLIKRYFEFSLVFRSMTGFFDCIIVLGLIIGPKASVIRPLDNIFIRLLKMIVMPIILVTIVVGAASIKPKSIGRVGGKFFIYPISDMMKILTNVTSDLIGTAIVAKTEGALDITRGGEASFAMRGAWLVSNLLTRQSIF